MSEPTVLLVEDEDSLVTLLEYNLAQAGFATRTARDGEEALLLATEETPDLVVLDWMLPLLSGIEVCRRLRRQPETRAVPIIMLTARSEESDKVRGLNSGADDYLVKPFSPAELIARLRALLRRANGVVSDEGIAFSDLKLDPITHKVWRGDRRVHLGPTEFRLLKHFMTSPKRVFSREQLLDAVWGRDVYVETRTVDVHIRRLRKALNEMDGVDLIRTVRAAGYALDSE